VPAAPAPTAAATETQLCLEFLPGFLGWDCPTTRRMAANGMRRSVQCGSSGRWCGPVEIRHAVTPPGCSTTGLQSTAHHGDRPPARTENEALTGTPSWRHLGLLDFLGCGRWLAVSELQLAANCSRRSAAWCLSTAHLMTPMVCRESSSCDRNCVPLNAPLSTSNAEAAWQALRDPFAQTRRSRDTSAIGGNLWSISAANQRVRGSSPWRRTKAQVTSVLGFFMARAHSKRTPLPSDHFAPIRRHRPHR
jgi:hypothetical protein